MNLDPSGIAELLQQYGNLLLLPLTTIEGPIVTILAGFLVGQGILGFWSTWLVVMAGDLLGDVLFYGLGRWGRNWVWRIGKYFGVTQQNIDEAEHVLHTHVGKTLLIGKLSHGVGAPVIIVAGMGRIPLSTFLLYNGIGTIPKSLLLLALGYYFGQAYQTLDHYLRYVTLGVVALAVLAVLTLLFVRMRKRAKLPPEHLKL